MHDAVASTEPNFTLSRQPNPSRQTRRTRDSATHLDTTRVKLRAYRTSTSTYANLTLVRYLR